jgi:REP element-mobilizing transposase RayT
MDRYKNKYRISSTRLQTWNYANEGAYFITICTKNREHFFGEIIEGKMILNEIGRLTEIEWAKTIEIRQDMNLELGAFVVMPNHFHAIVIIKENEFNNSNNNDGMSNKPQNQFGPQSKNLAAIIRGFKSAVTAQARKLGNSEFAWQTLYHDHIIRNNQSFENIQNYILNNPEKWDEDNFNK